MTRHTFSCIDAHTCGNPVRLVTEGGPPLEGGTMLEKRAHFLAEYCVFHKVRDSDFGKSRTLISLNSGQRFQ